MFESLCGTLWGLCFSLGALASKWIPLFVSVFMFACLSGDLSRVYLTFGLE